MSELQLNIINEAYFGEPQELRDAVVYLGKFRNKFTNFGGRLNGRWNADPDLDKFNHCIEKLFGFKSFYLHIVHNLLLDAHTVSCKYALSDLVNGSKIYRTSKGYKYNGIISAVVTTSTELMFTKTFSDREIMAILLHEIGHCFSNKLTPIIDVTGKATALLFLPSIATDLVKDPMLGMEELSGLSNNVKELYIKMNKSDFISTVLNAYDLAANLTKNTFLMILNSIPGIRLIGLLDPHISPLMPVDFLDENIADNFATMYGFGPELSTALTKLDMNLSPITKIEYETPVVGWFVSIIDIAAEFVMQLFDEHPTISSRRKEQYNYLLRELDKADANPRLKREIETEIARMEDAMHEIETDYGRFGGKLVAAKMNMLLNKLKHGDDIRSYIINSKMYGHIYDRPEYEHESAATTGKRTGVYESYINILNTKMI